MQKFEGTVITDNGLNLLTTVNGGDDKIQYTKAVLATDDLTQASATAIQKISELKIKMSSPISINSRINDTINLSSSFTNATITEDFDFYCIGWYAKGVKDHTDYLIAISPSTVKQTMPAGSNNAATASIDPKYAMALSRNAEVVINAEPAGSVTKEYVDSQINELKTQGIINSGSIVSTADDCNKMITTSYQLVKGSVPQNAPDGFSTSGQIIVYGNKDTTDGVTQLAYDDINGTGYVRSYNPTNNKWAEWDLVITKSQLNAVLPTDIARTGENNDFKGKNTFKVDPVDKKGDAYGLAKDIVTKVTDNGDNSIEINKQAVTPVRDNKNGSINFNSKDMTPADDSAVVHTTGDETINGQKKFDTVPTVDHNPLLLASSLPSDLARTGQAQTFTAAQTFSIAPTIKDASTDKGDNQAATMADLKSVINSSWLAIPDDKITLTTSEPSQKPYIYSNSLLYKVDSKNDIVYLAGGIILKYMNLNPRESSSISISIDFSGIAKSISVDKATYFYTANNEAPANITSSGGVINVEDILSMNEWFGCFQALAAKFPQFSYTPKS